MQTKDTNSTRKAKLGSGISLFFAIITTPDKHRSEPSFPLFLSYSVEAVKIESAITEGEPGGRLISMNGAYSS